LATALTETQGISGAIGTGRKLVSLVITFYNEQAAIAALFAQLDASLAGIAETDFEIVCVNDGSGDDTLKLLVARAKQDQRVKVVDLSRNFGKEAALTAGLDLARGDAVIPLDADLQDPPELIGRMLVLWRQGYEVVLARRKSRRFDQPWKRYSAGLFYRLHNAIADIKIPVDVGDCRLLDRKVVEALRRLGERRRFMKGIFAWVGFRSTIVEFERPDRSAGMAKQSVVKLWDLALEGITSFSTVPLRVWTFVGVIISGLAFIYVALVVALAILGLTPFSGYATLVVAIMGLGGIQLIGIGVLGEYVGRIYTEVKRRPIYIVRETYNLEDR
jgi:polyisoprenyl-phosphate glycosyltransferase